MDPSISCIFAPSGYGKTIDALYTAPTGLFLTPAPGGLVAARSLMGIEVREERCNSIEHACTVLKTAGKVDALILDDFSILAERSHLALDSSGAKGWAVWKKLSQSVLRLRELAMDSGTTLILTAHESQPSTYEGVSTPGGPKMPSKSLTTTLPHVATLVLRGVKDTFRQAPRWVGAYNVDPTDTRWITKDRFCVLGKQGPMNLREILVRAREVGHKVDIPRRAPGLEWLDEGAEAVAGFLAQGGSVSEAAQNLTAGAKGADPRHLRWAWRDGVARHELRNSGHAELFSLFT